jgi:type III secretory pathway component EscT
MPVAGAGTELVEAIRSGAFDDALAKGALVAARLAPLTVVAPWIALRDAAASVRAALVLLLTLALAPLAFAHADAAASAASAAELLPVQMLREAMVGFVFAVATAVPFYALDHGGRLVDAMRGASSSEVIAPPTGERTSPFGDLYLLAGVALFASLGGPRLAIEVLAKSFEVVPIGAAVDFGRTTFALGAARLFAFALAFGLSVAAPAALSIVLVEAALGLIARASPSIPVFFAGMPLRAAAGIAGSLLGLSVVFDRLPEVFRATLEGAGRLVAALGER